MIHKLKWLLVITLLLIDQDLCLHGTPPRPLTNKKLPQNHIQEEVTIHAKLNHNVLGPQEPVLSSNSPISAVLPEEERTQSAKRLIVTLKAKLQGQNQDYLNIEGRVSCKDLMAASTVDDSLSYILPQEVLGLSLVPVLVAANCPIEAQILVEKLYDLLGMTDTQQLLMDLQSLMEQKVTKKMAESTEFIAKIKQVEQNIEGVMFNIKQLAQEEDIRQAERCEDWARLNGTMLVGLPIDKQNGSLEEAVQQCEEMGLLCAGVAHSVQPGRYQAVLKKGSRILPADSESWILQCKNPGQRIKRSPQRNCINRNEQQVYKVMEWIPAVSTLYNLGTAVYYASVNCSETAKERAILTAVDLGTDALMVVTGGTAGVAGYALGAGVKTGVKAGVRYMMDNMKEEDDIVVNKFSWEDDSVIFQ